MIITNGYIKLTWNAPGSYDPVTRFPIPGKDITSDFIECRYTPNNNSIRGRYNEAEHFTQASFIILFDSDIAISLPQSVEIFDLEKKSISVKSLQSFAFLDAVNSYRIIA